MHVYPKKGIYTVRSIETKRFFCTKSKSIGEVARLLPYGVLYIYAHIPIPHSLPPKAVNMRKSCHGHDPRGFHPSWDVPHGRLCSSHEWLSVRTLSQETGSGMVEIYHGVYVDQRDPSFTKGKWNTSPEKYRIHFRTQKICFHK